MNTDPIADLLTRIRNAVSAGKDGVEIPYSRMKETIGKIFEEKGFIEKCRVDRSGPFPMLRISFSDDKRPTALRRISKPGRRVYQGTGDIRTVRNGFGISLVSTSKGVMTGEDAKAQGVGGEIICEIY